MSSLELSPVFPLREKPFALRPQAPLNISELFNEVTAFVEVRSKAENRSRAIAEELQHFGARVCTRLGPDVTHVVYREGCRRTVQWAERHQVPLVSVRWIQACKQAGKVLPSADFPALSEDLSHEGSPNILNARRRMRSMQPKSLEEDLKLSSERKRRNTRRNARRDELRRKVVEAEEMLRSFENDSNASKPDNYFADPCIYVAKTPPSMREFAERRERRHSVSSCASISPIRSPSRHLDDCSPREDVKTPTPERIRPSTSAASSSSIRSPRRRLVFGEGEASSSSSPSTSTSRPLLSHCRRLFDASTLEAGVLIDPQTSSNRLQDMSAVFPKAFQKRKIPASNSHGNRKRNRSCHANYSFLHQSPANSEQQQPEEQPPLQPPSVSPHVSPPMTPPVSPPQIDYEKSPEASASHSSETADIGALLLECRRKNRAGRGRLSVDSVVNRTDTLMEEEPGEGTVLSTIDEKERMRQLLKQPTTTRRSVHFSKALESSASSTSSRRRSTRLVAAQRQSDGSATSVASSRRSARRSAPEALSNPLPVVTKVTPSSDETSSSPPSGNIPLTDWVYSHAEEMEQGPEKVYGVLEKPVSPKRKSKRSSAALVLQTLIQSSSPASTTSTASGTGRQRPSLEDFKNTGALSNSQRRKQNAEKLRKKRKIVFTSLHLTQQKVAASIVNVLGGAQVRQKVDQQTTHVVTTWPLRRTLSLLRARLLGLPVLLLDWLQESREAGRWLPEEKYLIKELCDSSPSPATRNIFSKCASIFIASEVSPPQRDLMDIISLAGGQISKSLSKAEIVISSSPNTQSPCVDPKWVLDSIMACKALPLDNYRRQE